MTVPVYTVGFSCVLVICRWKCYNTQWFMYMYSNNRYIKIWCCTRKNCLRKWIEQVHVSPCKEDLRGHLISQDWHCFLFFFLYYVIWSFLRCDLAICKHWKEQEHFCKAGSCESSYVFIYTQNDQHTEMIDYWGVTKKSVPFNEVSRRREFYCPFLHSHLSIYAVPFGVHICRIIIT